jgi:hypothetical protein
MQFLRGATDVSFSPKCLKHHQKIEVETRQIQGLHGVLAFSFTSRCTPLSYSFWLKATVPVDVCRECSHDNFLIVLIGRFYDAPPAI